MQFDTKELYNYKKQVVESILDKFQKIGGRQEGLVYTFPQEITEEMIHQIIQNFVNAQYWQETDHTSPLGG